MEIFLTALAAIGALLTAVFMYPNFVSSRPLVRAMTADVPSAERRGSEGERLQRAGWFCLRIEIRAPNGIVIYPRSIRVLGISEMDEIDLPQFIEPDVPFCCTVRVRPQAPEKGELTVVLRYELFRWVRVRCPYQRTHYFGE